MKNVANHMKKQRYDAILARVTTVINELDPQGLLKQDAPSDEYDSEIRRIAAALSRCKSAADIQHLVHKVFQESFGEESPQTMALDEKAAEKLFHIARESP